MLCTVLTFACDGIPDSRYKVYDAAVMKNNGVFSKAEFDANRVSMMKPLMLMV